MCLTQFNMLFPCLCFDFVPVALVSVEQNKASFLFLSLPIFFLFLLLVLPSLVS